MKFPEHSFSIFDIDTRSFSKYNVTYFIFHQCLNYGLLGQTKPFVNGKEMSVYYLCKILSRELRKERMQYMNESLRIYIANSCNREEPRIIKTLAAKSLCSECGLQSTSQQFLTLEIYFTSFLSMSINPCQNQSPSAVCLIKQAKQQSMKMQTRMPFLFLTALFLY